MFRDSLLENCTDRSARRRWPTVVSFALQAAFACACIALPLLYPVAIPLVHASSALLMPPPSSGPPRPPSAEHMHHTQIAPLVEHDPVIRVPRSIPLHTDKTADAGDDRGFRTPGAVPSFGPATNRPTMAELTRLPDIRATVKPPPPTTLRISPGIVQGMLISRIEPKYPELPRRVGIQGDVVLAAIIGRDGTIENLHVLSGHPMLVPAAMDAVKQWRYRPYMLGSEPVEVETQITVRFTLAGR